MKRTVIPRRFVPLAVTMMVLFCSGSVAYILRRDELRVATFWIGSWRSVVIHADLWFDPYGAYDCDVWDGNNRVLHCWIWSSEDPGEKFDVLLTDDKQVVAVVREESRDKILLLYDFRTGASWPRGIEGTPAQHGDIAGTLQDLRKDCDAPNLVLLE